jgi:carbamoyltransferase
MEKQLSCGIAYNVHDSSVAFAMDNKVVLVLEAERVFKVKKKSFNSPKEMEYLVKYGLSYLGKKIGDVKYWTMATHQNPHLDKEDVFDLETGVVREPHWKDINICGKKRKVLLVNHHLSHAATYLMSNFNDALIMTCDGGGDYNKLNKKGECIGIYEAKGEKIKSLDFDLHRMINGKFYGACSYFLYGQTQSEGKMMALAAYGTPRKDICDKLEKIYDDLGVEFYEDSIKKLKKLFPNIKTGEVSISNRNVVDFSSSVQYFFSKHRILDTRYIINKFDKKINNIVLAGGACLNLDVNANIRKKFPKYNYFIAPCCDDTGQSLGALSILVQEVLNKRIQLNLPYLGMGKNKYTHTSKSINKAVDILQSNGVVILHNGQGEIGPRALGNRSLIVRPDNIEVKKMLSEQVKKREPYRPVAPVVQEEKVNEYFIGPSESSYMLYKYDVIKSKTKKIIGAVHYDNSARVQTITRKSNPFLYDLIQEFGKRTGVYLLLNTSLNLRGDPIANTIGDSLKIYAEISVPKVLVYNGKIKKINDLN